MSSLLTSPTPFPVITFWVSASARSHIGFMLSATRVNASARSSISKSLDEKPSLSGFELWSNTVRDAPINLPRSGGKP
ncbi:hypothetical protein AC519_0590 [Pseudomonas savastanoi]|nr:hypothetical protein AC519_0590 [Pseudomonas savastanoi]